MILHRFARVFAPLLFVATATAPLAGCKKKPLPTAGTTAPVVPASFTGDFRKAIDDSDRIFARGPDRRFFAAAQAIAGVIPAKDPRGDRSLDGGTATPRTFMTSGSAPFVVKDETANAWFEALAAKVPAGKAVTPVFAQKADNLVPLSSAAAIALLGRAEQALATDPQDPEALVNGATAAASLVLLVDDRWERLDPLAARAIELYVRATASGGAVLPNTKAALASGLGYNADNTATSGLLAAYLNADREKLGAKTQKGEAATVLRARFDRKIQPLFAAFVLEEELADRHPTVATFVERSRLGTLQGRSSLAEQSLTDLEEVLANLGKAVGPDAAALTKFSPPSKDVSTGSALDALRIADALGSIPNANDTFRKELRALAEAAIFAAAEAPFVVAGKTKSAPALEEAKRLEARAKELGNGGPSVAQAAPFAARLHAAALADSGAPSATILPFLVASRPFGGSDVRVARGEPETLASEAYIDEIAAANDRRPGHASPFGHLVWRMTFARSVATEIYAAGARTSATNECILRLDALKQKMPHRGAKGLRAEGATIPTADFRALADDARCDSRSRLLALIEATDGDTPEVYAEFLKHITIDANAVTEAGTRFADRAADRSEAVVANAWIAQYPNRVDLDAVAVRDTLAKVLLRQGKFKEAKSVLQPVLKVRALAPYVELAIAEAALGNRLDATHLLDEAEKIYGAHGNIAMGRATLAAFAGDGKGLVAPLVALGDQVYDADLLRIFTTLWRDDGEGSGTDGGVAADKLVPAFFAPGPNDVARGRLGLYLANAFAKSPRENARSRFLGALSSAKAAKYDPLSALTLYRALDRGKGRSEARAFLDHALPQAARHSPFDELALVAGADDLYVDGLFTAPKTAANDGEESTLMIAAITFLRSDQARVKAILAPIETPKSHYGLAAKWMAAPVIGDSPGITEEALIAYASDPRKGAEITAYLGIGFAMRGDHARAIRYLRATVRTQNPRLTEVALARDILNTYANYGEGALHLPPGLPKSF